MTGDKVSFYQSTPERTNAVLPRWLTTCLSRSARRCNKRRRESVCKRIGDHHPEDDKRAAKTLTEVDKIW